MKKILTECVFELAKNKRFEKPNCKIVKKCNFGIQKTSLMVDATCAKKFGMETGLYTNFEFDDMLFFDLNERQYLSKLLQREILALQKAHKIKAKKVLVVGLGNPKFACDSLGSAVANKILVTTPFLDKKLFKQSQMAKIYSVSLGVYGTTGIDSSQMIAQICQLVEPDLVVAIDSLVASSSRHLSHSVQISDTKLSPGGGVGNNRQDISQKTLGAKVFAIGVPLVANIGGSVNKNEDLIVTPKDIERHISVLSQVIATAINKSFVHLSKDDYLQLIS